PDGWHNRVPAILLGPTARYKGPRVPSAPAWWRTKSATPGYCTATGNVAADPPSQIGALQCDTHFSKSGATPQYPSGKNTIERARWRPQRSPRRPWSTATTRSAHPRPADRFHGPARPTGSRQASLRPGGDAADTRSN